MSGAPYFTKRADGHIEAHWPEPPRRSYLVSHELLATWVDTLNENVDLRAQLARIDDWLAGQGYGGVEVFT